MAVMASTKSQQVTPTESLNLVRNLLSTGLSCITYLRCACGGPSLSSRSTYTDRVISAACPACLTICAATFSTRPTMTTTRRTVRRVTTRPPLRPAGHALNSLFAYDF